MLRKLRLNKKKNDFLIKKCAAHQKKLSHTWQILNHMRCNLCWSIAPIKKMLCKDQKNIKKKKKNLSWLKLNSNHLDVHFFGNLLKCKYFNNSVDRSGLYLHVYILSWLAKILKFTVFRLYTKKLPHPWRDLIINAPINLSKDIWPLSTMKSF